MITATSVSPEPPELTYGSLNGFAYLPAMPGIAYRVLTKVVGIQEPGGRCIITENELAEMLNVHRSLVGRGFQCLGYARLVFRQAKGVYRLNPMISGYRTVADQLAAINEMDPEDRLDIDDYQERYDQAVAEAEEERRRRAAARKKSQGTAPTESAETDSVEDPAVLDFAAARRTRRRSGKK
ncbi:MULTISPECIES: hypothetical protein [unclassified Streptomyces]|uniref:hypothetical protein n=1 Tax=unclassified Streptomyces TaxID=2593676 RepID=UPI0035D9088B